MKTKNLLPLLLLAFTATFLFSCQKYEEGGLIKKTEENLSGSWKLQQYLRNSADETSMLLFTNYEESYTDNGTYVRTYSNSDNQQVAESGQWQFEKEQERLNISGVGSIEATEVSGTVSSSHYNIIKLSNDEFWYYFINGSDRHEFHLIKK